MVSLEDVRKKVDEKCMIVTNVHIDPDADKKFNAKSFLRHTLFLKSSFAILCDKDKREYLKAVRWWEKNFQSEITRLESEMEIYTGDEIQYKVWGDLWKDLEPSKEKNVLNDVPQIIVQLMSNVFTVSFNETLEIEVKGNLDVLDESQDNMGEECMLVNYIYIDVFEEGLTADHSIKSEVAVLCGEEKQEYLGRLRKWQQEYLPEIANIRKNNKYKYYSDSKEFEEWINLHWKNLEPNKNTLLDIPKLGVYQLENVYNLEGEKTIEVQGEIDHKWYYSEIPWYDIYGEEESPDKLRS